ncbi:MAG: hypothetical protein HKN25_00410 [Pyrinomonadaceae bacterium]|nr:hypothetical protein [Pyrinomonadaceae bacterium]
MNGLEIVDLKESNFLQKILRREPRENAFFEINNLLASVPILELDKASIDSRLEKYGVSKEDARSRLNNMYSIILAHFVKDWELTNRQRKSLAHLQHLLSLDRQEISSINSSTIFPIYRNYVRERLSDGDISNEEKQRIEQLSDQLGLPKGFAREIYSVEASKYLHSVLKLSLSDGMLSDGEEMELDKIARGLGVKLEFDADAKGNLDRCRYLWKLHIGELPEIQPPIRLPKKEKCFGYVKAVHYEVSRKKVPVKYSGFDILPREHQVAFHAGSIGSVVARAETKRLLDKGILYFNGTRLFFKGNLASSQFHYKNLIGGTFYLNGLLVEQIRGRDQFFKFSGDLQAIKLIFDALMTKSRS